MIEHAVVRPEGIPSTACGWLRLLHYGSTAP
jgi:hypothetical protein